MRSSNSLPAEKSAAAPFFAETASIGLQELQRLAQQRGNPCVSFYLPTHRRAKAIEQDPIRLKNLARKAAGMLEAKGMRGVEARQFLAPVDQLLEDPFFWRHQKEGLALFLSEGQLQRFAVALPLQEQVYVDDHFHLTPLIPVLSHASRFFVLALSQNQVRLLECSRNGVSRKQLQKVPASMSEALAWDDPQRELQFHTGSPRSGAGKRSAVFHGSDGLKDSGKDRILRFFRKVDAGLQKSLGEAPLILAAVEYLIPIYRTANSHAGLAEEAVAGNPEKLGDDDLRRRAWPIAQSIFRKEVDAAAGQYENHAGNRLTSDSLKEILPAAAQGRVRCLFAASGAQQWGRLDESGAPDGLHRTRRPGDLELVDWCVLKVMLNGGQVFVMAPDEVPGGGPLAALFRY